MDSIQVSGKICAVDKLPKPENKGDPTHQLVAPIGHKFSETGWHCIPCFGAVDVKSHAARESLTVCEADCDCRFD